MNEPVVQNHLHYYEAPPQPQRAQNGSILVYDTRPQRNPAAWYIFILACCGPPGWAVLFLWLVFVILRGIGRAFSR